MDLNLISLLCMAMSGHRDCIRSTLQQDRQPHRVCYYTTWARYRPPPANMKPKDVDPFLCSHIIIAFAWISDDGRLSLQSEWEDTILFREVVALKKLNPNLKILAAVGGWNFGSEPFKKVCQSEATRLKFAQSIVPFLKSWRLDGFDIDWEYPKMEDRERFTLLIQEVYQAFVNEAFHTGSEPYLLTAAVAAIQTNAEGYDVPAVEKYYANMRYAFPLAGYFNFINVMTYDMHGPWDKQTGHNAPLYSYDNFNLVSAAQMWEKLGMPKEKIVLGVASYGHSFKLESNDSVLPGAPISGGVAGPYTRTDGFFSYFEVCTFVQDAETVQYWDSYAMVPYACNKRNTTWVSFDSTASIRHKVKWVLEQGYGGIMLWELGMDDFTGSFCPGNETYPILRTINDELGVNLTASVVSEKEAYSQFLPTDPATLNKLIRLIQRPGVAVPPPEDGYEAKSLMVDSSTAGTRAPVVESSPVEVFGNQCQGDSTPRRKDCEHFTRCDRGILHEFVCPPGTMFSNITARCDWPWEVPGCYVPTTSATASPTTTITPISGNLYVDANKDSSLNDLFAKIFQAG